MAPELLNLAFHKISDDGYDDENTLAYALDDSEDDGDGEEIEEIGEEEEFDEVEEDKPEEPLSE
jgi:hypothetical protein